MTACRAGGQLDGGERPVSSPAQPPQFLEPLLGEDHLPPNGFARLPKARTVMVRSQLCPFTPRLLGVPLRSSRVILMSVRLTLTQMQTLAYEKGGQCLSTAYVNNKAKLRWRCQHGHEWEAVPSSIKQGHWCPHCTGLAPLTLMQMQVLAREKGGQCFSTAYVNTKAKLRWRCQHGHEWEAVPNSIQQGSWCPWCRERRR